MKKLIVVVVLAFTAAAGISSAQAQIMVTPPRVYVNPVPPVMMGAPPVYANPYPVAPVYVNPYPRYGMPYRVGAPYHPYYHGGGYSGYHGGYGGYGRR